MVSQIGIQNSARDYCSRPQTKFAKVIFSQVSYCPRGGGGGCLRLVLGRGCVCHTHPGVDTPPDHPSPPGQTPPRQTPPGRHTRPVHAGIHPPVQCMLEYTPPAQCMLGYTPHPVHAGIRSTSGWYTSQWNAFLTTSLLARRITFVVLFTLCPKILGKCWGTINDILSVCECSLSS